LEGQRRLLPLEDQRYLLSLEQMEQQEDLIVAEMELG
jgi:hypothetical protein